MKKKPLIGFIITTMLCALIIFSSGCFTLTETRETSDNVESLRLKIDDGKTDLGSDGSDFHVGDIMLKIEQSGGDPIDWSQLTLICEDTETDDRANLVIINCNNAPYDATTNRDTKTGQIVDLGVKADGDFQSGDRVELTITKGDDMIYKSQAISIS